MQKDFIFAFKQNTISYHESVGLEFIFIKYKQKFTPFFEYSYIITPGNFLNLSEENKQKKLGQFFDVLRIIESLIRITMSKKIMLITIEGKEKPMPVMQVPHNQLQTRWVWERWQIRYSQNMSFIQVSILG